MTTLKQLPPHLPAPTCSIKQHAQHERLKFFFIAAFFGVLGGISGAAMMLGWIWPTTGGLETWRFSTHHVEPVFNPLESRIAEDTANRLVGVYKEDDVVGAVHYFTSANKVGEAVILTTDGWLALYVPKFEGSTKNWRVLGSEGEVFPVEESLIDRVTGMLYLKIGNQDRVVAFADPLVIGDDAYVHEDGQWLEAVVESTTALLRPSRQLDSAPRLGYGLNRSFTTGSAVFSRQGRLVGFVAENGIVLSTESFESIVTSVLSGQGVSYLSLGVEGFFDQEEPLFVDGKRVSGFLVTKVINKNTLLKRGDVIVEANGQIVTQAVLWHTIYAKQPIKLMVLRAGKKIPITPSLLTLSNF